MNKISPIKIFRPTEILVTSVSFFYSEGYALKFIFENFELGKNWSTGTSYSKRRNRVITLISCISFVAYEIYIYSMLNLYQDSGIWLIASFLSIFKLGRVSAKPVHFGLFRPQNRLTVQLKINRKYTHFNWFPCIADVHLTTVLMSRARLSRTGCHSID